MSESNYVSFAEFLETRIFCILARFLSTFYDFDIKFRGCTRHRDVQYTFTSDYYVTIVLEVTLKPSRPSWYPVTLTKAVSRILANEDSKNRARYERCVGDREEASHIWRMESRRAG